MSLVGTVQKLASVNIFEKTKRKELFVGRPFYLDYNKTYLLIADAWKNQVKGIPQGTFLLAFYENEDYNEALLLRALGPTKLPTDNNVITSMVEYYKDNLKTSGKESQLDDFTRYEFSFSGLECRILGTFYKNEQGQTVFGADVENFYSSHNYSVYKPEGDVLEFIANLRDGDTIPGNETDVRIGKVRYSSSARFQENLEEVPVYVTPKDFLGKRTALFGMTRTGKSNTVKKVIEATVELSKKAKYKLGDEIDKFENLLNPFDNRDLPKYPVGQIIFDINGEYANANLQDEGTAIFELYNDDVIRYSFLEKEGFKIMKINFYNDILSGFNLIYSHLEQDGSDYVNSFRSVDLQQPEDPGDHSSNTRYEIKKAAYLCCLYKAGFSVPQDFEIKFKVNKELRKALQPYTTTNPGDGITLQEASDWFNALWDNWNEDEVREFFVDYVQRKGHEWADEDLRAILAFLTRKRNPGSANRNINGFIKLRELEKYHTDTVDNPFDIEIIESLRDGKIVIVDLSQGDPQVQQTYSKQICIKVFQDSMNNFTSTRPNNFTQFYFEEAHNLFPKKEDKDLSQIYNRIAKEGAKLNIGLIYATQEVSSISSNILKNTQNWFISHLNNHDELKELTKYYDFCDFTESLIRFSAKSDKGFIRMKTYSNPFVVPVQIDRFLAKKEVG